MNPIAGFQTLLRVHLSPFQIRTHIACFQMLSIGVTETTPLDENRNVSFFYWKLVLFGHNNAHHDILGIHDYP